MKQMGVDCGVLLETKLTEGVYTRWSSGYNVRSTHAPSKWQGGISLFWRTSEMYEIEEVELCGPNVLSFQLVSGATRRYIIGCYILPTDLTTLAHIDEVWRACPKGCLPILLGDSNVNLAALRKKKTTRSPNKWTPWRLPICLTIFVNGAGEDPGGDGHGG